MFFALDENDERIAPRKRGRGRCPSCKRPVIAKCGLRKIDHWAHERGQNECDPWAEGETRWHRDWQLRAEPDWCEVVMENHRADIRRPDGLVIELQHSPIKGAEVEQREAFYRNMWWLFDAQPFRNFRVWLLDGGEVQYRWMTRRTELNHVRQPLFLDLGGPIVEVLSFGVRGCISGKGRILRRSEFIARAGLRPLSQAELRGTSHYELRREIDDVVIARSISDASWFRPYGREIAVTRHNLDGSTEMAGFMR